MPREDRLLTLIRTGHERARGWSVRASRWVLDHRGQAVAVAAGLVSLPLLVGFVWLFSQRETWAGWNKWPALGQWAAAALALGSVFLAYWLGRWSEQRAKPRLDAEVDGTTYTGDQPGPNRLVRVRVWNSGERVAKGCRVYLIGVTGWSNPADLRYQETHQLRWSHSSPVLEYQSRDLTKGVKHAVDLAQVHPKNPALFFLTFPNFKLAAVGSFRVTILVSDEDADPVTCSARAINPGNGITLSVGPG